MIRAANTSPAGKTVGCAIYTRKSHEEGLEQEFNSLHAQRESCESYIASQKHEGWKAMAAHYDDGGYSGGSMERPALQQLLKDIEAGLIDCVVVYKVDRLSRSLMDFARLVALFDQHNTAFVSVTQRFDTTSSMGRLTLNILLSFAQFEREIIGERIRDKIAAAKRRGQWIGGSPFLGYDIDHANRKLVVNEEEAKLVRHVFDQFIRLGSTLKVARELNAEGHRTKSWTTSKGKANGGHAWNKIHVHRVLTNPSYIGLIRHKDQTYKGQHEAIVDRGRWDRVQAILQENGHIRAVRTRRRTAAMLKGILRCGHCGKTMGDTFTTRRGKRYHYYLCNHAEKSGYDSCPVKSVPAGEIESAVLKYMASIFRDPAIVAGTIRSMQDQWEAQREDLLRQKQGLEDDLARQRKMIRNLVQAGGQDGEGALADELRGLNDEHAASEKRLAEANVQLAGDDLPDEREVIAALRNIDPLWEALFPAEKQRIVSLLVEKVVVNPDGLIIRLRVNGLRDLVAETNGVTADAEERMAAV